MVTFHININETKINEFAKIVDKLKSLGVIESVESNCELVREGEPLNEDTLMDILAFSKKEIESSKLLSMSQVKNQIDSWKKER